MRAGVVYPQIELGGDPGAVKAFAQAAESLGYDHLVIYDHVLGAEHAGREHLLQLERLVEERLQDRKSDE